MIDIKGGSVLMGCTAEQEVNYTCNTFEDPVHRITVFPFQLGKFEITQSEWDTLVPERLAADEFCMGPDQPACLVSFYEALTYCNRLSLVNHLRPCYYTDTAYTQVFDTLAGSETMLFTIPVYWDVTAEGYRLPTESEWEYAARAGENNYVFAGSNEANNVAWYAPNSVIPYGCRNVGTKNGNAWGLQDMSGNVWEWTWDHSYFYPAEHVTNSIGPLAGWQNQRSARGGSYVNFSEEIRVATRGAENPGLREEVVGFRIAKGSLSVHCTETLVTPAHTSIDASTCAAIRWRPSNFAVTGYMINIGTSPLGNDLLANHIVPDTFYYPEIPLPASDTLFIRIIPFTHSDTARGCTEFWFVTGKALVENPLSIAPPEQPFICEYTQELTLLGNFADVDSIKWSTGESTPTITVNQIGVYTAQVYFSGCRLPLHVEIQQGQKPVPDSDLTIISPATGQQANGAIDITVINGVSPYKFTWEQFMPPYAIIGHDEDIDSLIAGRYNVYILDEVGCGKNWFYTFMVDSLMSNTSVIPAPTNFLFPRPATNHIYLMLDQPAKRFLIYNVQGQLVLSGNTINNSISMESLSAGQYLLLLEVNDELWWSDQIIISR